MSDTKKEVPNHQHEGECVTGDCYICDAVRRYCSRPPEPEALPLFLRVTEGEKAVCHMPPSRKANVFAPDPLPSLGKNHQHVGECATGECPACDAFRGYCSGPPDPLPSLSEIAEASRERSGCAHANIVECRRDPDGSVWGKCEGCGDDSFLIREAVEDAGADDVRRRIVETCDGIRDLLLAKNEKYGNSALEPRRIFSKASAVEQILVRIDDKLSRIATMGVDAQADEDTVKDLIGYLVLLLIARK